MRSSAIPTLTLLAATLLAAPTRFAAAQDPVVKPTTTAVQSGIRLPASASVVGVQRADGQIEVHWTPVVGATRYDIIRSIGGGGVNLITPGPTDTSYVDPDVKAGFVYYYVVQAVNGAGSLGLKRGSNAVQAKISASTTTQGLRAATPTEELTAGVAGAPAWNVVKSVTVSPARWFAPSHAVATVSWQFAQGGVSFIVERALEKGAWQTLTTTPVIPCCSFATLSGVQGLTEGSRIVYRITAVDAANPAHKSVPVTSNEYTVSYKQLPAPARFAGMQQTDGTIRLTWAPVAGAIGYTLVTSDGRSAPLSATDTTWVDQDVVAGYFHGYTLDARSANLVEGIAAATHVDVTRSAPTPLLIETYPTARTIVTVGGTRTLEHASAFANVKWVSLDDALATVDAGGTVSGRSPGSARLLMTAVDTRSGAVIVYPYRVDVTP